MENTDNVEKVDLDKIDWKSSREFFESLGEALDKLDDKDESYNFTWVGKRKSIIEAGAPINKTLRPDIEVSKDFDNTKNMLIVGDNLDALKLLQESYLGKIKMIYIDPPYNTGHDFVYHDNFVMKADEYEDDSTDDEGNKLVSEESFRENSKANGRFHSDWLSMMYPRLKLARNLLSDDGVIFISIDDNEQTNLKKVCDDVFGEVCYHGMLTWVKKTKPVNMGSAQYSLQSNIEYVLVYGRESQENHNYYLPALEPLSYPYIEDNGRKYRITKIEQRKNLGSMRRDSMLFDMFGISPKEGYRWQLSPEKKDALMSEGRLYRDGDNVYCKTYEDAEEKRGALEPFWQHRKEVSTAEVAKEKLEELFECDDIFQTVKPLDLMRDILLFSTKADDLILDFFAGSGTTGHAVMDLNAEDSGKRKYILVQLDEKTDEKSEAKKAGYDTIDQITAERLRRAGDRIKKEHPEAEIDTGFRVFRVDSENENPDIHKPLSEINQSDLFNAIDNIKKDRTPLDLLFGVVYASALPFDLKLETRKIGDNTVYFYGYLDEGTGLVACFDDNVSEETIKEIAKLNALTAAFKDSSFADSAAKINLSEQFRVISPDTKVKVI